MRKILLIMCLFSISGCSVLTSPTSWNARPLVIDADQTHYKAISTASDIPNLIAQGDLVLTKIQSLTSIARRNLDKTSAGNFGAGLILAAVGLSSLHSDALLGAGFLAGTHVSLSTRLSPPAYMQQLQRSSNAIYCLNNLGLGYENSTSKIQNVRAVQGFNASTGVASLGYTADPSRYTKTDLGKFKQTYQRALELSQGKLDSQISLTAPADIQNQLIQATKEAATSEVAITALPDSDSVKGFLVEHAKLDSELLACLAQI